ncbi:hypothetical protein STEG23_014137 [Scotinomys teguina]
MFGGQYEEPIFSEKNDEVVVRPLLKQYQMLKDTFSDWCPEKTKNAYHFKTDLRGGKWTEQRLPESNTLQMAQTETGDASGFQRIPKLQTTAFAVSSLPVISPRKTEEGHVTIWLEAQLHFHESTVGVDVLQKPWKGSDKTPEKFLHGWATVKVSQLLGTLNIDSMPKRVLSCHGVAVGHYTSTQAVLANVHGLSAYSELNKIFSTRSFCICRSHGFTFLGIYPLLSLVTGMEDVLILLFSVDCFLLSPCNNEDKPLSPLQRQHQSLREAKQRAYLRNGIKIRRRILWHGETAQIPGQSLWPGNYGTNWKSRDSDIKQGFAELLAE